MSDNQSQRTVGSRGPATLENYHFLAKISHFDRERIPERVVHARGFVCHGEFEATGRIGDEPASKYTRARRPKAWGTWTSSVPNTRATAEDVLGGMPMREMAGR